MTDTLHKNTESCTGSDTPETDAEIHNVGDTTECLMVFAEFARKLERERDEAYLSLRTIEEILSSGVTNDVCFWGIREELEKYDND